MALDLNQFAPNVPVAGLYVYQANLPQLHNVIISENQATALTYGAVVTLDGAVSNTNAPAVKQAAVTNKIFGVISFNPRKATYVAGERVAIARENDIVWMPAAGAITQGATLYFNSSNQVTSTGSDGYAVIGTAITSAAAANDFVQVELGFSGGTAAEPSVEPSAEPSTSPSAEPSAEPSVGG